MKSKFLSFLLATTIVSTGLFGMYNGSIVRAKDPTNGTYQSKRLSGNNRYSTALAIANEFSTGTLNNVVVATGNDFPDALAGSVLAAKLNAPILLVGGSYTDTAQVIKYIMDHLKKDGNIYILGGTGAVSDDFINNMKNNGYRNIVRLGGANREETAKLIDSTINVAKGTPVIIATENDFPDALSISSAAGINKYPILLSKKDGLPQATIDMLKTIQPSKVYIIGGTGVLTSNIDSQINSAITLSANGIVRIAGNNRYETSLSIAKTFNLDTTNSVIATGNDFPDALAGSVLAAKLNAPILLIDNSNITSQKQFLDGTKINNIVLLGGTGAINTNVEISISSTASDSSSNNNTQPPQEVSYQANLPYPITKDYMDSHSKLADPSIISNGALFPKDIPFDGSWYRYENKSTLDDGSEYILDYYYKTLKLEKQSDGSYIKHVYEVMWTNKNGILDVGEGLTYIK